MEITKTELAEMISPKKKKPTLVGKKVGKWTTIIMLIFIFGIGVFGSFNKADFDMNSYVLFLSDFKWYFGIIAGSVGLGTTAKTITKVFTEKKKEDE